MSGLMFVGDFLKGVGVQKGGGILGCNDIQFTLFTRGRISLDVTYNTFREKLLRVNDQP